MAVGDAVFDDAPLPPLLITALNYERWGVNVRELPAGLMQRMTAVLNVYHAVAAYRHAAGRSAQWARANPDAWEIVSAILRERMERKK